MPDLVKCSYCHQPVSSKRKLSHELHRCPRRPASLAKVRPLVPTIPRSKSTSKRTQSLVLSDADVAYAEKTGKFRCWECLDWVKDADKMRHYQRHNFEAVCAAFPAVSSYQWLGCVLCTDVFRLEEMPEHIRSIHPKAQLSKRHFSRRMVPDGRLPIEPKVSHVLRVIPIRREDPAADMVKTLPRRQRDSLDATVRYAERYREGGKFGSHAGHDGYGDESKS